MDNKIMERFTVERDIHEKRFEIMQHYLALYGGRLNGKPSLYERYNSEEVAASSKEGQTCMHALQAVQRREIELAMLLQRFVNIMRQELEGVN